MEQKNIISRTGLNKIKEELKNLIEVERPKVIADIKEARGQGDLSENAEFDAAREKQGQIEDRISEIERIVREAKVISSSSQKSNKVIIGSTVKVKIGTVESEFTIVGGLEADPIEGSISNVSPLGEALLNKSKGDSFSYNFNIKGSQKSKKGKILKVKNN